VIINCESVYAADCLRIQQKSGQSITSY